MFGIFPLSPAYGRDYKTVNAAVNDWESGKDFKTVSGQYCSCRDFPYGQKITVRFNGLRSSAEFINRMNKA